MNMTPSQKTAFWILSFVSALSFLSLVAFDIFYKDINYDDYVNNNKIYYKSTNASCSLSDQMSSHYGNSIEEKREFCLWDELDFKKNNASVCRIFSSRGLNIKKTCYHNIQSFESFIYKYNYYLASFLIFMFLTVYFSYFLESRLATYGPLSVLIYSLISDVIIGRCQGSCPSIWLFPTIDSLSIVFWMVLVTFLIYSTEKFIKKKGEGSKLNNKK